MEQRRGVRQALPRVLTGFVGATASSASVPAPAQVSETTSQANAREKAESYLDCSAFSHSGLIKQLVVEGFTSAQAQYGVDAVGL